jgi:uncharacterized phage protein gp47/JayE
MFKARTIDQAQQDYLLALAQVDSPIELDSSQGSVVYTLSRGAAALATAQDLRLESIEKSYLTAATGEQLDNIGRSFELPRLQPSVATGSVLVISLGDAVVLPEGTRLVELTTGLEFITVNTTQVSINTLVETQIDLNALQIGSSSNLPAGTRLFSLTIPGVRFIVGQTRTTQYNGDLVGGSDLESDESYRSRIGLWLSSRSSASSSELLLKLLEKDQVDRAFVKTSVGGLVEIWVDSVSTLTNTEIDELRDSVIPFVAAGTVPVVIQANRIRLNFELIIEPFRGTAVNLQELTPQLNSIIRSVIDSLDVSAPLFKASLVDAIKPFVRSVVIVGIPRVVRSGLGNILVPGDIKVTYPINI